LLLSSLDLSLDDVADRLGYSDRVESGARFSPLDGHDAAAYQRSVLRPRLFSGSDHRYACAHGVPIALTGSAVLTAFADNIPG